MNREEGRKVYDDTTNTSANPFDYAFTSNPLTPYGEQVARQAEQQKIKELQCQLTASTSIKDNGMKNKLSLIADLFQMDVMSEEDALKACKTVIEQYAKKVGKSDSTQ